MKANTFTSLLWINFSGASLDHLIKNSLIIFLGFQAQSPSSAILLTTMALSLFMLPCLLLSSLAGQWGDSHNKVLLFKQLKTIEYGVIAIICYALYIKSSYLLCLLMLPVGVIASLSGPLKMAMIDERVDKTKRGQSSTLFQLSSLMAMLLGTTMAGSLLQTSLHWLIGAIVFCSGLNAAALYRQHHNTPSLVGNACQQQKLPLDFGIKRQYTRLYRAVTKHTPVFLGAIFIALYWFFIQLNYAEIAPMAKFQLHTQETHTAQLYLAMILATACGAMMFLLLNKYLNQNKILLISLAGISLGYLLLAIMYSNIQTTMAGAGQLHTHVQGLTATGTTATLSTLFGTVTLFSAFQLTVFILFLTHLTGAQLLYLGYALLQINGNEKQKTTLFAASNVLSASGMILSALLIASLTAVGLSAGALFLIYALLAALAGGLLWRKRPIVNETLSV